MGAAGCRQQHNQASCSPPPPPPLQPSPSLKVKCLESEMRRNAARPVVLSGQPVMAGDPTPHHRRVTLGCAASCAGPALTNEHPPPFCQS